jgi:hypothetical protein
MGQSAERHQKNLFSSKLCLKEIDPISCELKKTNRETDREGNNQMEECYGRRRVQCLIMMQWKKINMF